MVNLFKVTHFVIAPLFRTALQLSLSIQHKILRYLQSEAHYHFHIQWILLDAFSVFLSLLRLWKCSSVSHFIIALAENLNKNLLFLKKGRFLFHSECSGHGLQMRIITKAFVLIWSRKGEWMNGVHESCENILSIDKIPIRVIIKSQFLIPHSPAPDNCERNQKMFYVVV